MVRAQRTINPLHFEDLEPHRFEDLIRQLAYKYRPWRYLDATGKLGRDQGTDIRGTELVSSSTRGAYAPEEETDPENEMEEPESIEDEREWRISCKRYKELGPTEMRSVVAETLTDPDIPPYGFVLAVACDVSAESIAVFREESFARGVEEAHLWTKAHLEDMLFLPENDHLLFAYFGISLGVRRASQVQRVRASLATKRKILRAAKIQEIDSRFFEPLLVRDIDDVDYPHLDEVDNSELLGCLPWHPVSLFQVDTQGLVVSRFSIPAWVRPDGTWDVLEAGARLAQGPGPHYWWEYERELDEKWGTDRLILPAEIPFDERTTVHLVSRIPYDFIVEVDPIGDPFNPGPHVYCRFDGAIGPYIVMGTGEAENFATFRDFGGLIILDPADRRALIGPLLDEQSGPVESARNPSETQPPDTSKSRAS